MMSKTQEMNGDVDLRDGSWYRNFDVDECPVDPDDEIETVHLAAAEPNQTISPAQIQFWRNVAAFRVVQKATPVPQTFWGYLDRGSLKWEFSENREYAAERHTAHTPIGLIEMQEVL